MTIRRDIISVVMFKLICTLVVLLCCTATYKFEYVPCKTCDQLIVDEINNFRANLICNFGLLTVKPISMSEVIFHSDVGGLKHPAASNSLFITHDSCGSDTGVVTESLDEKVKSFIKNCASRAENLTNNQYSWFWNPETRRIHCVYAEEPFRINCIANEVQTSDVSATIQMDKSVNDSVEEYITYRSNLRFCKNLNKGRGWLKTCSPPLIIRDNIQNGINTFREYLVEQYNVSNMPRVNWNTELEMVASEFGKLWEPEFQTSNCISSSQFDNLQLFHLPLYTSVFNYDRYVNPMVNIISNVNDELKNESLTETKSKYFWIYDTSVTDFGCVLQMTARTYANLVCVYSGNLENDISTNFKYGPPCSDCPKLFYCESATNGTKLCGRNENDLPYKHFIIYGCLIVVGFAAYFYLRHH